MDGLVGDFGSQRCSTPKKVSGNRLNGGRGSPRRRRKDGPKKAEPRGEVAKAGIEAVAVAGHTLKDG